MSRHIRGADPLPRVVSYLGADPAVTTALGGTGRVGAVNMPPYPRLLISRTPGGVISPSLWLFRSSLTIGVLGDPDGRQGKAVLTDIAWEVIAALHGLVEDTTGDEGIVVTDVACSGPGENALADGQRQIQFTASITSHP